MSWAKIHLLDVDAPFNEGADVVANCGTIVRNAKACFASDWASANPGGSLDMPHVCRQCRTVSIQGLHSSFEAEACGASGYLRWPSYVYGLIAGEEAIREGAA